jgi:hypothetical protein
MFKNTMAGLWLVSIPAGLWATRTVGTSLNNAIFAKQPSQPPDTTLDHEGALASAKAALQIRPLSPTANHLRTLIEQSADKLEKLVKATEERVHRRSWSRMFRDPDFSAENQITAREIETLKSRVQLFLNVVMIFPSALAPQTKDQENQTFSEQLTQKEELTVSGEEEEYESDFENDSGMSNSETATGSENGTWYERTITSITALTTDKIDKTP